MPPFPRRLLRYQGAGTPMMHGADIARWQRQACRKGYLLRVDGWFGPRSSRVAKALQKRAGLAPDGVIDARTWASTWL